MLKIFNRWVIITLMLACGTLSAQEPSKPKNAAYYYQKGDEALTAKSYKTALAHFTECLRLDPYFMDAYLGRGRAKENLGDSKGALNDFNIYLESKPDNKDALFTRATVRFQFGQWAVAREDFLKLLKLPPGETNTVFYQTDRVNGSTSKIMTAQGDIKPVLFNYVGLIDTRMKNYKRATSYFDSALRINSNHTDALVNKGLALQLSGDTVSAIKNFRLALAADPENSLARHNLAILSVGEGSNFEESLKLLTEAIEKNPQLPYSYAERGYLLMKRGEYKRAHDDYTKAIQIDPKDADYFLNRAIIREKLKDTAGAFSDYGQAIKLREDYEKIWLNRGNLSSRLNKMNEAIEDYTVAIRYYPEYGIAYYNRAVAYQKINKLEEARADIKKAESLGVKADEKLKAKLNMR